MKKNSPSVFASVNCPNTFQIKFEFHYRHLNCRLETSYKYRTGDSGKTFFSQVFCFAYFQILHNSKLLNCTVKLESDWVLICLFRNVFSISSSEREDFFSFGMKMFINCAQLDNRFQFQVRSVKMIWRANAMKSMANFFSFFNYVTNQFLNYYLNTLFKKTDFILIRIFNCFCSLPEAHSLLILCFRVPFYPS